MKDTTASVLMVFIFAIVFVITIDHETKNKDLIDVAIEKFSKE